MTFKCVYNSVDYMNVHIAKSILANEGIESFIPDDQMSNLIPSYTLGGSKLMIRDEDFEDAEKALKEFKDGNKH